MAEGSLEAMEKNRWRIDLVDVQLAALLRERLRLSLEVQRIKAERGLPQLDRDRETTLVRRVLGLTGSTAVSQMMRAIVAECRRAGADLPWGTTPAPPDGSSTAP